MLEFLKKNPENILYTNLWGSSLFRLNNKPLKKTDFPSIESHMSIAADFLSINASGKWVLMSNDQIWGRYGRNIRENELVELRYIFSTTLNSVQINDNKRINFPIQPTILSLIHLTKKGCSKWTQLLKWRLYNNNENRNEQEHKWENKLGNIQGPFFWNRYYRYAKSISYDNKIKWLQHQIMRNSLKTNYIVAKFIDNFSPLCSFCIEFTEKIEHLFWDCRIVQHFLNEVRTHFNIAWSLQLALNKKMLLFGKNLEHPSSPTNLLLHHVKRYIWQTRCLKAPLNFNNFVGWYRREIDLIKKAFANNEELRYLQMDQYDF